MNKQLENTYLRGRKVHIDRVIYCFSDEKVQKEYLREWVKVMGGTVCAVMNEADLILAHDDLTVFDKAYEFANLPVLSYRYVHDCATTGVSVPVNEYLIKRYEGNQGRVLEDGGLNAQEELVVPVPRADQGGSQATLHQEMSPLDLATPSTPPSAASPRDASAAQTSGSNVPQQGPEVKDPNAHGPPMPTERLKKRGPFNEHAAQNWGDQMVLWYLTHTEQASATDTIRGTSSIMTSIVNTLSTHTYQNVVCKTPGIKSRVKALIAKNKHRAGEHVLPRVELYRLATDVGRQYARLPGNEEN